jgi:hypothetical protein
VRVGTSGLLGEPILLTSIYSKILNDSRLCQHTLRFDSKLITDQLTQLNKDGLRILLTPAALQFGNDETMKVANREEFLRNTIRNVDTEMLFGIHHQLD